MFFSSKNKAEDNNWIRDLALVVLSVIVSVILFETGALESFLASTQQWRWVGSFLAGLFFVSVFTTAPAGIVLFELAKVNSVWEVALLGGLGALTGDLVIFRLVRDNLTKDITLLLKKTNIKRLTSIFRMRLFRWLVPFIGALVIASPLPDEVGLTMMGLTRMKTAVFVPISFTLNFLGILVIALLAKDIL